MPLGAFLSGGIDSSAIVGLMASLMGQPVETFTIGFDDATGSTSGRSRGRSRRHRTNHHEFVVHPDAVDLVEKLVWHHDQPFGDSSAIPTYLLSEVTAQHVTVALAGTAATSCSRATSASPPGLAARRYAKIPPAAARDERRA